MIANDVHVFSMQKDTVQACHALLNIFRALLLCRRVHEQDARSFYAAT